MVGLLPLCAITVFEGGSGKKYPAMAQHFRNVSCGDAGTSRSHSSDRARPLGLADRGICATRR